MSEQIRSWDTLCMVIAGYAIKQTHDQRTVQVFDLFFFFFFFKFHSVCYYPLAFTPAGSRQPLPPPPSLAVSLSVSLFPSSFLRTTTPPPPPPPATHPLPISLSFLNMKHERAGGVLHLTALNSEVWTEYKQGTFLCY